MSIGGFVAIVILCASFLVMCLMYKKIVGRNMIKDLWADIRGKQR